MRSPGVSGPQSTVSGAFSGPSLFVSEMTSGRSRAYLVALEGRTVVGYAGLVSYGDEAHVTTIAVDPDHHRRKIGTRLLYELMKEAKAMGAASVSLEVRMSNWGAQRMYGKFGFRPVGVRKNYYQETNEDALVMWTDDIRTPEYTELLRSIAAELPEGVRPQ
jgi:ribosomal-protein-alanine N-acetyltransferase